MKVLVIIPAYNEESNIENVISYFENKDCKYDYIVVNDCSKDSTEKVLRENKRNYL